MSELNNKVKRCFGDYAVDKRLAYELELAKLPRYVAEFLISEFMIQGGDWEGKLRSFIRERYYEPEEKEVVKHKLVTEGVVELIDELRVYVDVETGAHIGVIHSLDIWAEVPVDIVERNRATLTTGMWGLITLQRWEGAKEVLGRPTSVVITDFKPFQAPDTDPKILEEGRRCFTLEEWVEVLINTIGLDPAVYSPRQRLLLLARLVPLVEGNVNMAEFGPRQTGKTYLYRNVSNYVRIISGGVISPAALFYNLRTKVPGELALKDAVVFDEVSKVRFPNPDEMMGKLKDYMESGHYERGDKKVVSDASLVFMGNVSVEHTSEGYVPVEDLTYVLPEPMRDSAFIDRIHGLLPGWEFPKISQSKYHLSKSYGVASDYFAEALHGMRKESLSGLVGRHVELSENFKIRDEKSFKRITSGLLKLLFPDKTFDKKELKTIAEFALEMRQRVRDWLHKIAPGEFPREILSVGVLP
ncbi:MULTISPECIES: BREX system Lon protease-like protein BrxL [Pyrobaculum]|uniref:ATP-dependent protease La n=2 Tax=Pyrobaculum arsenaticum TaxID=121277 RepID=A4WL06_PYRAR|nr:BREX system Lon protease-like protein BrxL [Pyrobaculum arsenaticum]ABP51073.1 ATP-dependent protease La [Pyrobaculum arsenaticum DSM 13514]MCY0891689.1 BREX system Lon protease-like protein BrxL [Pyrobaculum arsenaticum]NYR15201.1 BREX system Lon protease-like protein BrxL [Pyrobaculum arsenaticum]